MRSLIVVLNLLWFWASAHAAPIQEVDRIVAVVNDDVVLESELRGQMRAVEQQLAERQTRLPPRDVLRRQVLERLIINRLQLQTANSTGIRVSDDQLNNAISRIAAQNRLTLGDFRATLEREGYDFARFREDIRNQLIITQLRQRQIVNRIKITEQEIDGFLATRKADTDKNKEYRLLHILIAVPEAASPETIQTARAKAERVIDRLRDQGADFNETAAEVSDGQQAFEGGDLGWRKAGELPTLFAETAQQMAVGDVKGPIRSPSGFHVIKLAEVRGEQQHIVTETEARHILLRTNELTSDDDARIRLQQLRLRLEGGEDFASLARAHSEDRGSAARGGALGWVKPGDLVPQFEEEMNALSPSQVSKPFKTQFGWHIVQVLGRRSVDNSAEFARDKARQQIQQRKIEEETEAWLRRLRDEAFVEYRLDDVL